MYILVIYNVCRTEGYAIQCLLYFFSYIQISPHHLLHLHYQVAGIPVQYHFHHSAWMNQVEKGSKEMEEVWVGDREEVPA